MPDPEDLDPPMADRIRRFADAGLADFDPEQIAARAAEPIRRPFWQIAAVVGAAVAFVIAVFMFASLGTLDPLVGAGQSEAGASRTPSPASPSPVPSRASPTPVAPPLEPSEPQSPAAGLTRAEAIAAAREAAPHAADYPDVLVASAGPFGTLTGLRDLDYASPPPLDRWVWHITLCKDCGPLSGQITTVIIDFFDGRVYGVFDFIS